MISHRLFSDLLHGHIKCRIDLQPLVVQLIFKVLHVLQLLMHVFDKMQGFPPLLVLGRINGEGCSQAYFIGILRNAIRVPHQSENKIAAVH